MEISVTEQTYRRLRSRLFNGGFRAGQRVSDLALSAEMGVSRTPVREAISQLQSEGFLEHIPRFGTFVRKLDRDELDELFDIREALEGFAAALAATRVTDGTLGRLAELCQEYDKLCEKARSTADDAGDGGDADVFRHAVRLDMEFHMLIVESSGNRYVAKAIVDYKALVNIMSIGRDSQRCPVRILTTTREEHARILDALRRRDPDAARLTAAKHVADAKIDVMGESKTEKPGESFTPSAELQAMLAKIEKYVRPTR